MLKPLSVIVLTVGLIIAGWVLVNSSDGYIVNCLCAEGYQCPCPNFIADAILTIGFLTIAAGAALPVLSLIAARHATEISG